MSDQTSPQIAIVYRPIESLLAHPHNARTHSKRQVHQIASSIREFGFTNPVLIDRNKTIIAGHGRVTAALKLGIAQIPTIQLEHLTDHQLRAYVIADNRLAERAGWDKSILAIELQHLSNVEANFDITITGFEIPEVDLIIEEAKAEADQDDSFTVDDSIPATTQPGDLWLLGKHRILCGNSLDDSAYKSLLKTQRASVAFLDPPYNIAVDGNVSGHGHIKRREFAMASGEMDKVEFVTFLIASLGLVSEYSLPGSVHFICIDWRHMNELLTAGEQTYDTLLNVCVWVKNRGGLGSFYRSRHEMVFVFRHGKERNRNNIQLGQYGRNRTNVWDYPVINAFSSRDEEGKILDLHPTLKPVALVADALLDCSARGDIVLDSFLGSGTTLIAAERVGRVCFGIEIDPLYVDVAIRRWQRHTGNMAIHATTHKTFDELQANPEASHDR